MRKLEGRLSQSAADTSTTVIHNTGARQDKFEGIFPAYIRLRLDAPALIASIVGSWITASMGGVTSNIELFQSVIWYGGTYDPDREWYPPAIFIPLFDEQFYVKIESAGTAAIQSVDYVMYYDVKTYSELEMIQTIEGY